AGGRGARLPGRGSRDRRRGGRHRGRRPGVARDTFPARRLHARRLGRGARPTRRPGDAGGGGGTGQRSRQRGPRPPGGTLGPADGGQRHRARSERGRLVPPEGPLGREPPGTGRTGSSGAPRLGSPSRLSPGGDGGVVTGGGVPTDSRGGSGSRPGGGEGH